MNCRGRNQKNVNVECYEWRRTEKFFGENEVRLEL